MSLTAQEVIEREGYLDDQGRIVHFPGIGRLRGKNPKKYSPAERTILNHFFTNLNSNVYCATDNMPSDLWALFMGQYARSKITAKSRFLQLLRDTHKEKLAPPLEEIATSIENGKLISAILQPLLDAASTFIEKWGITYGHASLRDASQIRIAFEGVSQYATNIMEKAREGAYQEQSTRALPFTKRNLGMPYEIKGTEFEERFKAFNKTCIDLYKRVNEKLKETFGELFKDYKGRSRENVDKAIVEEAFDNARYLLPQNMTTSLGMTLNTRRFQDMLTFWKSHPVLEIRVLGEMAQIEAMKLSPSLIKHGGFSPYLSQLPNTIRNLNEEYFASLERANFEKIDRPTSELVTHTEDLESFILTSVLRSQSTKGRSLRETKEFVKSLSDEQRRKITKAFLESRGRHDLFPKQAEIGSLTFERFLDIGAYRDLQRQRGDRQQYPFFEPLGFIVPPELAKAGFENEYIAIMHESKKLAEDMADKGYLAASQYCMLMGNVVQQVTTMDPVQQFYQARLRTAAGCHFSYRDIAQQEIKQTLEILPAFKGLIPFDNTQHYKLGRLEELIQKTK